MAPFFRAPPFCGSERDGGQHSRPGGRILHRCAEGGRHAEPATPGNPTHPHGQGKYAAAAEPWCPQRALTAARHRDVALLVITCGRAWRQRRQAGQTLAPGVGHKRPRADAPTLTQPALPADEDFVHGARRLSQADVALGLLPGDAGCGTGTAESETREAQPRWEGLPGMAVGREDGAALTMLDVLPEDPVLGVVLKRDEAALLGAAHLQGESRKNHRASAPIPSASLISLVTGSASRGCGKSGLGCDTQGQDVNPKCPDDQRHVADQARTPLSHEPTQGTVLATLWVPTLPFWVPTLPF